MESGWTHPLKKKTKKQKRKTRKKQAQSAKAEKQGGLSSEKQSLN